MKINIENVYPIIERDQTTPKHIHYYRVKSWEVQGTYIIDGDIRDFKFYLIIEQQFVTNAELIEMIKRRLKNV